MKINYYPYVLIAAGGFTGAILRWYIDVQIPSLGGTLIVNFLGCFVMGVFMYESIYIGKFSRDTRIFFGVGVIGAFTTFSALAVQSFQAGPALGMANILANLLLGFIGILAGRHIISYQRWN
nr:fluoride efflux transporter CrcB [uncultured Methanoregula sp.]